MNRKGITDASTAAGVTPSRPSSPARIAPALTVVSHPMPHRVGERCLLDALPAGKTVELSRNSPEFLRPGSAFGTPLVDPFVSRKPIQFMPGKEGAVRIVRGEGTALAVNGVDVPNGVDLPKADIAAGAAIELANRVVLCLHFAVLGEAPRDTLGMVGESSPLADVRRSIEQVVDLNVPILIRGETGTGKELVARAIHEHSPRRGGPFVAVNLGAIPKDLAAAELFGAQKGAYTGSTHDRTGFFRAADGGTLFLDEVGEASSDVQVLLLRVLETGKLYPVGGSTPISVDVRLIAATDADLEERIRQGQFKAPLLHRLSGYEIRTPPLRSRREDIGRLFYQFALEELKVLGEAERLSPSDPYTEPWLPASIATRLLRHPWPGNVRQLRNVTRQLVIGSRGKPCIDPDLPIVKEMDLTLSATAQPVPVSVAAPQRVELSQPGVPEETSPVRRRKSTEVTSEEVIAALRKTGWDVKAAAEWLNVPRSSMYDLIDKCPGIRTAGDLTADEITACFRECQGDLDRMVQRLEVSKRALNRRVKELGLG